MSREILDTEESKCNFVKTLTLLYTPKATLKKVTIVMDSIWFDRKYDLIYELIWLFTKKYSPFVISNFLLISGSPMFIQGKTSKQDQTYNASPQYGRIFLQPLISTNPEPLRSYTIDASLYKIKKICCCLEILEERFFASAFAVAWVCNTFTWGWGWKSQVLAITLLGQGRKWNWSSLVIQCHCLRWRKKGSYQRKTQKKMTRETNTWRDAWPMFFR